VFGRTWGLLGDGYLLLGDLKTAKKHIDKSIEINVNYQVLSALASSYRSLASVHRRLGNLTEAQNYAKKALELSQKNNNKDAEGSSKIFLGRILGEKDPGKVDLAEKYVVQGMKILEELKLKPALTQGYLVLGVLYGQTDRKP